MIKHKPASLQNVDASITVYYKSNNLMSEKLWNVIMSNLCFVVIVYYRNIIVNLAVKIFVPQFFFFSNPHTNSSNNA